MVNAELYIDPKLPRVDWLEENLKLDFNFTNCKKQAKILLVYAHDSNMRLSPIDEYLSKVKSDANKRTLFFSWYNLNMREDYFLNIFGRYSNPEGSILRNTEFVHFSQLPYDLNDIKSKIRKLSGDV